MEHGAVRAPATNRLYRMVPRRRFEERRRDPIAISVIFRHHITAAEADRANGRAGFSRRSAIVTASSVRAASRSLPLPNVKPTLAHPGAWASASLAVRTTVGSGANRAIPHFRTNNEHVNSEIERAGRIRTRFGLICPTACLVRNQGRYFASSFRREMTTGSLTCQASKRSIERDVTNDGGAPV